MELRAFADQVLRGESLADKLVALGTPTDLDPGSPIAVPAGPGRPPELVLGSARARRLPTSLRTDEDRGRVLHAFANHELLALELLAAAILRFPYADPRQRRAWAAIASDEQDHLRAYLDRMRVCGVALGDEGLSGFFWSALSGATDADRFTVGLGLVLEQANLDFSRWWQTAFARAGDPDTAAVLDQVYQDEIRHVRLAANRLREIRLPGESEYDAFARHLDFPLTPARARGPDPDREGRRRAGLSDGFVDRVLVAGASKGRDPRLYTFHPHAEDELAGRPIARSDVAADLAGIPILLAGSDDAVLAPRPTLAFATALAHAGFAVPSLVDAPPTRVGAVRLWARTPATCRALGLTWDPRMAALYDKAWAVDVARDWVSRSPIPTDPADVGVVCRSVEDVERAVAGRPTWVKAGLSTAGTHRIRADGALDPKGRAWVERAVVAGAVVVEPHLDVVAELSVQGEVDQGSEGEVRILGVTRFGAVHGVYRGTVVGPATAGCGPEVLRFLNQPRPGAVLDAVCDAARFVGERAAERGLVGPFGVDALVVRGPEGLRVKPIGELNPRTTMGRVALALRKRLHGGSVGAWLFLPIPALVRAGLDPTTIVAEPMDLVDRRIRSGVVATTDPAVAKAVGTWLVVEPTFAGLVARIDRILDRAAEPERLRPLIRWLGHPSEAK